MGKLLYTAIMSLDGYVEDEDGKFDWAVPDDDVHAFINDAERPIGTYLYGRRMYDMMVAWETDPLLAEASPLMRDFAGIWRSAEKIIFSTTMEKPLTSRTRVEHTFDPEAVIRLKSSAERDVSIGGPELAAHAFRAGLVDECHLYLAPVIVGGGKAGLPAGVRLDLELLEEHRFAGGTIYVRYQVGQ